MPKIDIGLAFLFAFFLFSIRELICKCFDAYAAIRILVVGLHQVPPNLHGCHHFSLLNKRKNHLTISHSYFIITEEFWFRIKSLKLAYLIPDSIPEKYKWQKRSSSRVR